jgi:hypothetical protein
MGNIVSCCCGNDHNEESREKMNNIDLNRLKKEEDSNNQTVENEVIVTAKSGKLLISERPETNRGVKSQPNKQIYDIKRPSCDLDKEIEFNRTFNEEITVDDNEKKLTKASEEIGTKVKKVITFTVKDKIDETEMINNHEYRVTMDFNPRTSSLGNGIVKGSESAKIKRTIIFKELTDKEEKQKKYLIIKYILINLNQNIIGQSVNITDKSNKEKERLTFPSSNLYQSKLPVRYQKYTEKQKEFASKILKTNEYILENTNLSSNNNYNKRRDPADLSSYSLFELEKLHLRFILDHLFMKSLDKGENSVLPLNLKQKLEGSIKQTSLGTTEFENLRLSIINENDLLFKNKIIEKNAKESVLPKLVYENNTDEMHDKIVNSQQISDYRVKLLYLNKFYKQVIKEDIAVSVEINNESSYKLETNSIVVLNNPIINNNKTIKDGKDKYCYSLNRAKKTVSVNFYNIHPNFINRIENSEEQENILNEKEKSVDIIFSQPIKEIVKLRESVRDKLNEIFFNELQEIISIKNVRNTYSNKINASNNLNSFNKEDKIEDDSDRIATAKYLLNKIKFFDEDEVEVERIKYYSEVKESLANDDNYADNDNEIKNFGNIF